MKWMKILIVFILILMLTSQVQASENVLNEQKEAIHISDFIEEANQYSKEAFPNLDMGEVLNSAIRGEVNDDFWYNVITCILGKEVISAIRMVRFNSNNNYHT